MDNPILTQEQIDAFIEMYGSMDKPFYIVRGETDTVTGESMIVAVEQLPTLTRADVEKIVLETIQGILFEWLRSR